MWIELKASRDKKYSGRMYVNVERIECIIEEEGRTLIGICNMMYEVTEKYETLIKILNK